LKDAGIGSIRKSRRRYEADKSTLLGAGVTAEKTLALTPFLKRMEGGEMKLGRSSVVVIDEIALIGTKQMLRLSRLQASQGFQIVGIGDDMQCQSIEAGATVDLCRRAFGAENVPELLSTVRQVLERDRETSLMFREGNAAEAIARKDQDGTLIIVPGGRDDAIRATVDLWWERREANSGRKNYTLGISVPTNEDGRLIGEEIRIRRRLAGELGRDLCRIDATDQNGATYKLTLARGDRIRLFDRVFGKDENNHIGFVGNNGSVLEVVAADRTKLMVRKANGQVAAVEWEDLRAGGERIRLARGDAVTIDARQSETVIEHITSMPSGSEAVNGFKAYVAESRQREKSWIITSQGAEMMELQNRRAIGDPRNKDTDPARVRADIIANIGRNLSRQPKKTLATDFLERAVHLKSGAISAMQAAWFRQETRQAAGQPAVHVIAQDEQAAPQTVTQATPVPIEVPAEVAPALKPTAGWKLHLNVAPTTDDRTTRAIADWLDYEGISFKVGQSGGQDGKGMTIYVGPHAKARDLADELEDRFRLPPATTLPEDARWSAGVNARFDADGDGEFHQYGVRGVPVLVRHVQDGFGTPDHGFNETNAREAEIVLISRYGALYGPAQMAQPAEAATVPPEATPVPSPVPTPSQPRQERPQMSEADIQAAFAAELERYGLRVKGAPVMDGEWHRAPVDGDRGAKKSGSYRGWLGADPGGIITSFKGGTPTTWRPERGVAPMSADELAQWRASQGEARSAREAAQKGREEATAKQAEKIWKAAKVARPDHPYLVKKGIGPSIARQAVAGQTAQMTDGKTIKIGGRLIIPMRDVDGKLWNVQMIAQTGSKMFLPGRKKGLFAVLGKDQHTGAPMLFAEGFATGETLHNTTALRTVITFDSGNILPVAREIHAKHPDRQKIFAADNDHHLPGLNFNLPADEQGRLSVTWQKGATGSARDGNTVEYRVAGADQWTQAVAGTRETGVDLGKLVPDARYEVRVFSSSNKQPLSNVGVDKTTEAAAAVGGRVVIPPFGQTDSGTDWNDYRQKFADAEKGKAEMKARFSEQGVPIASPSVAAPAERTPEQRAAHTPSSQPEQQWEQRNE
jgi:phage/plasmid primase-like uncharacterized protein